MQALDKKLLRDFQRLWVQALAIALVLACGVAVMLMSFGMSQALDDTRAAYYERNRFADVFVDASRVPKSLLPEIRKIEGVLSVEARIAVHAILDIPGRTQTASGLILSLPATGEPALNVPLLRSGNWPDPNSTTEVVVNEPFATANRFRPGDTFEANLNGRKRTLTISGTALSPEFIYTIGPGALMPDNSGYGIIWMPDRAVAAAFDMAGAFDNAALKLLPGYPSEPVITAIDDLLRKYGGLGAIDRSDQQSNAFIDAEIKQLRAMALVLPPIFLAITAFLVNMVIGRIVALERSEIGLLKAVGYSNLEICLHYLMLAGLIALSGIAIGWVSGSWLSFGMAQLYARFFDFPYLVYNVSYTNYAVSGLLGLLAAGFGALRSALKAAWLPPAIAMAPPAPTAFKESLVDRIASHLRFSQPTMMILRNMARWPVRSAFTMLGMALAVSILVASSFFPDSLDEIIDTAFHQSNRQDNMLLFAEDVPESALQEIKRLPGVMQAEGQLYHAAILRNGPASRRVPIEGRPPGTDLSRIVGAEGTVVDAPEGGILLSERLANALSVRPGDMVEAEFLSGLRETVELPVMGIVTQHFGLGAYMDQSTLNRLFRRGSRITVANVTVDASMRDDFNDRLKDLPKLSGSIRMTENLQSFQETISENIIIGNTVYAALGIMITIGVAYNGARVQLSERARELASLRILGFTRGEVSYILIGETLILALLAQPLGWWIGYLFARLMAEGFTSDLYSIPLVLYPSTYAYASLIVLLAALGSVMVVRRRLDRLDLVAVMKTRE